MIVWQSTILMYFVMMRMIFFRCCCCFFCSLLNLYFFFVSFPSPLLSSPPSPAGVRRHFSVCPTRRPVSLPSLSADDSEWGAGCGIFRSSVGVDEGADDGNLRVSRRSIRTLGSVVTRHTAVDVDVRRTRRLHIFIRVVVGIRRVGAEIPRTRPITPSVEQRDAKRREFIRSPLLLRRLHSHRLSRLCVAVGSLRSFPRLAGEFSFSVRRSDEWRGERRR